MWCGVVWCRVVFVTALHRPKKDFFLLYFSYFCSKGINKSIVFFGKKCQVDDIETQ